jgi:hypothetical protein
MAAETSMHNILFHGRYSHIPQHSPAIDTVQYGAFELLNVIGLNKEIPSMHGRACLVCG